MSVGLSRTNARAQSRNRPAGSGYCSIVSAPRSIHSSSEYRKGYRWRRRRRRRRATPQHRVQAPRAVDHRERRSWSERWRSRQHCRKRPAPRLPPQRMSPLTSLEIRRRSRLSRGRSIKRCGPSVTGQSQSRPVMDPKRDQRMLEQGAAHSRRGAYPGGHARWTPLAGRRNTHRSCNWF